MLQWFSGIYYSYSYWLSVRPHCGSSLSIDVDIGAARLLFLSVVFLPHFSILPWLLFSSENLRCFLFTRSTLNTTLIGYQRFSVCYSWSASWPWSGDELSNSPVASRVVTILLDTPWYSIVDPLTSPPPSRTHNLTCIAWTFCSKL